MAVAETWLTVNHSDSLVDIPGYTLYRCDRIGMRGGGVCIYLKNNVFSQFKVTVIPNNLRGVECLFLSITLRNFSLICGCVYRPSNSNFDNDKELFAFLPDISWPLHYDLNVSTSSQLLIDFLTNTHAVQIVEEYTRYRDGQNPSLLDLIFVSDSNLAINLEYLPPIGKSDHVFLRLNLQTDINIVPKKTSVTKIFLEFDRFGALLDNINWNAELSSVDVNENWLRFSAIILRLKEKCSRSKTYITNPSKPWINDELFLLVKRKKALWQKFKRSKLAVDYVSHRLLSNILTRKTKCARINYEDHIIESNNPKVLFKYIRRVLSTEKKIMRLSRPDCSLTTSDHETANYLAQFFSQSYSNAHHPLPLYNCRNMDKEDINISFDTKSVFKKLQTIKDTACPGPDKIPPAILKHCSRQLSVPLHLIMEQSFNSSALPEDWKTAYICPVYKEGNKLEVKNYRPISLTCPAVKIMESIIVDELENFMNKHALIPSQQHGFTKGRSIESNLLSCLNDWSSSLDNSETFDILYLDFSKAFDKVPIHLLILKLKSYGISGRLLAWIECFLSNRTFSVKVDKSLSDVYNVLSGVPQGSVLGPKLFLLYTADIPQSIVSTCAMYADDIKLYNTTINAHILQNDLNKIYEWSEKWGIPLNSNKCVVMHVGKKNPEFCYRIEGESLRTVTEHNDLGILIHRNLSWANHVLKQVKKANSRMYILHKTFAKSNTSLMAKLFRIYVRPILEFGSVVWFPDRMQDMRSYENVQRRYTRWCYGFRRPSYENRLILMKLPSLMDRKKRGDLIYCFKILQMGKQGENYFTIRQDVRLRGHRLTLVVPRCKTNIRKNFFSTRIIKDWNKLPDEIIKSESVNVFKNRIDKFYSW